MKDKFFIGFVFGVALSAIATYMACDVEHSLELNSVGIDRIVSCEINTTNCHSNWNEIVWIEK